MVAGTFTFAVQESDCNVVLYNGGRALWSTGTANQCTHPYLVLQGDGNLILLGTVTKDGVAKDHAFVWASGATGDRASYTLGFYTASPYIAVIDDAGTPRWTGVSSGVGAWKASVFRAEHLDQDSPADLAGVGNLLNGAFTPPVIWARNGSAVARPLPLSSARLDFIGANSISITQAPGYPVNPFRSLPSGAPSGTGDHLTYKMRIFASAVMTPGGSARVADVNAVTDTNSLAAGMITFDATAIVANPYSDQATLASFTPDGPPDSASGLIEVAVLRDTQGAFLNGIEPTLTFDHQLIVWNSNNKPGLLYSFNPDPNNPVSGWTPAQNVVHMATDANLRAQGYPIARNPVRRGTGDLVTKVSGAYPWISPEGSDVFFTSASSIDGAGRSATSLFGTSTKGTLRQLDGALNVNRRLNNRLFISSPGRTPGMWSPLEFLSHQVIPLTDKLYTYPLFFSNAGRYAEASFEEALVGNYDVYLEMNENMDNDKFDYDLAHVADSSGNAHYGTLSGGANFAEEAFPADCLPASCPRNDPSVAGTKLFSGKALYMKDGGALTVSALANLTNADGSVIHHSILAGAPAMTVSFAVQPLAPFDGRGRPLVEKADAFKVTLTGDGHFQVTLHLAGQPNLVSAPLGIPTAAGALGPIPLGDWTHFAFTVDTRVGSFIAYVNGQAVAISLPAGAPTGAIVAGASGSPLIVGPGPAGGSGGQLVYAIDQVGVSRVARTPAEILRQAGKTRPRTGALPNALADGLKPKDVRSDVLLTRALSPFKIALGSALFADPRLSQSGQVACTTCHLPGNKLSEPVALHANLLAFAGGLPHIQRNAPSLLNLGFQSEYFWDGRAGSLADQAHTVLTNPNEMGASLDLVIARLQSAYGYAPLFARAYGSSTAITKQNVKDALQEFELSLASGASAFDRQQSRDPSFFTTTLERDDPAARGRALFFGKAHCAQCHAGSDLSDGAYHNVGFLSATNADGALDAGRFAISGGADDAFKFRTPSLRNIALTGPYFHDGSLATLEDVVAHYNSVGANDAAVANGGPREEMIMPIHLTAGESGDLVAFLRTLTSSSADPAVGPIPPGGSTKCPPATGSASYDLGKFALYSGCGVNIGGLRLSLADDGNFGLFTATGQPLFMSATPGQNCAGPGCLAAFQGDGNLVLYDGVGKAYWSAASNVPADAPTKFVISPVEPYLHVESANGSLVWTSSLGFAPFHLHQHQFIRIAEPGAAALHLWMQDDGNLVVYRDQAALWGAMASNFPCGNGQCDMNFQSDGNLVLYNGGAPYWTTSTSPAGRRLRLSGTAHYLRVQNGAGTAIWTSASPGTPITNTTPTPSPTPTTTATPGPSPTPTVTVTPSPTPTATATPVPAVVIGTIDGISSSNAIFGWTCVTGVRTSIQYQVYVQDPNGTRRKVSDANTNPTANLASEPAVAGACKSQGSAYRYSFPMSTDFLIQNATLPIIISGVSTQASPSSVPLTNSGAFSVPLPPQIAKPSTFSPGGLTMHAGDNYLINGMSLIYQFDGNLVLYTAAGVAKASTGSTIKPPLAGCTRSCVAAFQGDGNLVLYNAAGSSYWSSATAPVAAGPEVPTRFAVQAQAPYLQIFDGGNNVLWSDTNVFPFFTLMQDHFIRVSANGQLPTYLYMQNDGNVVILRNHQAVWASNSGGKACNGGCFLNFQSDGNLVAYKPGATPTSPKDIWSSGTGGKPITQLALSQTGAYIQLQTATGATKWQSNGN